MEVNTLLVLLIVVYIVFTTILVAVIGAMYMKQRFMEYALDNMPDPQQVIEDVMKTKIPVILGPDGQPMIQKPVSKNPLVG